MDLMTAIALAPSQPPGTVVGLLLDDSKNLGGWWFCRIECFCRRGFDSGDWGDALDVTFELYNPSEHARHDCQCNGRVHRLDQPYPLD